MCSTEIHAIPPFFDGAGFIYFFKAVPQSELLCPVPGCLPPAMEGTENTITIIIMATTTIIIIVLLPVMVVDIFIITIITIASTSVLHYVDFHY